jgi:putative membrane protein
MRNGRLLAAAMALSVAGCTTATNTNSNSNANRLGSVANSAVNTAANAANTVANTVSNTAAKLTTKSPADFLTAAAQGGMAEVELAKIASTRATDPELKSFAQLMSADHAKVNAELKALAAKKNIPLPGDVGSHRSTIDDLKARSGADFDAAYIDAMVEDHETDVAEFQSQADNSSDPDVKAFAAKVLPTLKAHLEKIKAIQARKK